MSHLSKLGLSLLLACGARTGLGVIVAEGDGATPDARDDEPSFVLPDANVIDVATEDSGCPAGYVSDGDGGCIFPTIRRPFLVGSSLRSATRVARADWSRDIAPCALDVRTKAALAEVWLKDALEEHASVAAFARFTMQLLSVGAPPDLVVGSQRASIDEVHHAKLCFALAARYRGRHFGPSALRVDDAMSAMSLVEIAALVAAEGCVGETLGAALAAEQLALATDREARAALHKIAADESRHAELAWRFAKWAARQGGDEVKHAIAAAAERAIESSLATQIRSYEGVDTTAWHAHGRLTCRESHDLVVQAVREVLRPCLATIAGAAEHFATVS